MAKLVVILLIILGIGYAVVNGVPQRSWAWFKSTGFATSVFSLSGSEEKLPGPLRGFLDPNSNARLSVSGVIQSTNEHREKSGLVPLHNNDNLARAAEAKIDDMFAQQYFEHVSPDGKSPADIIKEAEYEFLVVGENLALGNFTDDPTLVQAWMDSPGHRANILNNKFYEIGVAVRKGNFEGKEVWLAVQEFGAPLSTCPTPSSGDKARLEENRKRLDTMKAELDRMKSKLESTRYESNEDYNREVEKYNQLAEDYRRLSEETQRLVDSFNDEVRDFNRCLESYS